MPSIQKPKITNHELVQRLDKSLPQTQCGLCGYGACLPYAEAMARGQATPDLCPPGGAKTLQALCEILDLDVASYHTKVLAQAKTPQIAVIDENQCIGCTKCIQACPVDAIIGSNKMLHTIIAEECTGCELCIEPCPVDCIDIKIVSEHSYQPDKARQRYYDRNERLQKLKQHSKKRYHDKLLNHDKAAKLAYINSAIARAKEKRLNNNQDKDP